jgi:hypothetical protein
MYLGMENTVFLSGRWPRGGVCFYGALVSLYEPEDEPAGDCLESRRSDNSIFHKSASEAVGGEGGGKRLSAGKILELIMVLSMHGTRREEACRALGGAHPHSLGFRVEVSKEAVEESGWAKRRLGPFIAPAPPRKLIIISRHFSALYLLRISVPSSPGS